MGCVKIQIRLQDEHGSDFDYGLKNFSFSALIGLKCLALPETSVMLISLAAFCIAPLNPN
jgi:hypothetical protein